MHFEFASQVLSIAVINLVLSGDNGVVVALAAKKLPARLRLRAVAWGAACAVVFQLAATCFAAQLLQLKFLRFLGGIVIVWIAVGLFRVTAPTRECEKHPEGLWQAIGLIVFANLTMSTDNILAIAATARGSVVLLAFGLGLSIPLVVFASGFVAGLMDRYPGILYLGAAILGKVGAEMIVSDPFIVHAFAPGDLLRFWVQTTGAVGLPAAIGLSRIRPLRAARTATAISHLGTEASRPAGVPDQPVC